MDGGWLNQGIIPAEALNKTTIARCMRVGNDNTITGGLFLAHTGQTNLYCHVFFSSPLPHLRGFSVSLGSGAHKHTHRLCALYCGQTRIARYPQKVNLSLCSSVPMCGEKLSVPAVVQGSLVPQGLAGS